MLARSRLMPLELRHGNEMIGAQGTSRGESRGGGWWSEHNRHGKCHPGRSGRALWARARPNAEEGLRLPFSQVELGRILGK